MNEIAAMVEVTVCRGRSVIHVVDGERVQAMPGETVMIAAAEVPRQRALGFVRLPDESEWAPVLPPTPASAATPGQRPDRG